MNRSLATHDHADSAECGDLRYALLDIIEQDESILALRHCLTIVEQVMHHHPAFCIELRYVVGIAHELAMDCDTAEIRYAEMAEREDYTCSTWAAYMTYRYQLLTARISSCPSKAREYFTTRALIASDEIARIRQLGAVALR